MFHLTFFAGRILHHLIGGGGRVDPPSPHPELEKSPLQRLNFCHTSVNNTDWDFPDQYDSLKLVGAGAYGQVWYVSSHRYKHEE